MGISLSKSSIEASNLPTTVGITPNNPVFNAPFSDFSEYFTQSGSDVPVSNWNGSWRVTEDFKGNSFIGNGVDAYVDLTSKLPALTNFIGVSLRVRFNSDISTGRIFSITDSTNSGIRPFEIAYFNDQGTNYGIYVYSKNNNGGTVELTRASAYNPSIDEYVHVFAWVDLNEVDVNNRMELYINGVLMSSVIDNDALLNTLSGGDNITIGASITNGSLNLFGDVCVGDLHVSTDPNFKNELNTYYVRDNTTRFFQRPRYTGRELLNFEPTGVPISEWKNSPSQIDGIIGKAVQLNNDKYIEITSTFPIASEVTTFLGVSFWFRTDFANLQTLPIFTLSNGPSKPPFSIYASSNGSLSFYVYSADSTSNRKYGSMTQLVRDGNWHHVFAYADVSDLSNDLVLYLDGDNSDFTMLGDTGNVNAIYNHTSALIGRRTDGSYSTFQGDICDFYWSTDPLFKNYMNNYMHLPTVEIN